MTGREKAGVAAAALVFLAASALQSCENRALERKVNARPPATWHVMWEDDAPVCWIGRDGRTYAGPLSAVEGGESWWTC